MRNKKYYLFLMFLFLGVLSYVQAGNETVNENETSSINVYQKDAHGSDTHAEDPNAAQRSEDNNKVKAELDAFPNLHPLIVHFPIVLLLLGGFLQLIQLFRLDRNLDWVILLCVGAGFIGAYVAGTYAHPHAHGLTNAAEEVLVKHDLYADWTIYSSALGAVLKLVSLFFYRQKRVFEIVVFLVLGISAYAVSEAGHYGSQLVHIEGVGPQGNYLESEENEHSH